MKKSLLVIAGEVSGDMHAARIVRMLRERCPELECWGVGGDELQAAGMDVRYHVRDMAVLGIWEVLKRYPFFRRVFADLLAETRRRRPDAVLLVDYPGFNLRFARHVHGTGPKILYYVCPQVWAWHRSRIGKMARIVDRLMVIFPFEIDVFKDTSLRVDFVGHPLIDAVRADAALPQPVLPWGEGPHRVALLPGSRRQEVERILPAMIAAACSLTRTVPDVSFLIAAPSEAIAEFSRSVLAQCPDTPPHLEVVAGKTRAVLRQARAAMVASGTATIETALIGCPMIVVYKTAALTYWFGKRVIQVPHLGMVNIVAGHRLCPEFLQDDTHPDRMAEALAPLLRDGADREKMVQGLQQVATALGSGGGPELAAEIILSELDA